MYEKLSCLLQNKNIRTARKKLNITKKNIYLLFLKNTVVMKGRKGQPSLQDLRDYYKRQQSRNILKKSCVFLKEKKKQLTASGSQREDEHLKMIV